MGATPQQYFDWRKRAEQGTLSFSEIIEEMPNNQHFAFGCHSCWIFFGQRETFDKDIDLLDIVYCEVGRGKYDHAPFLMHRVMDVRLRHWDGEHLFILIQLEGDEEGFLAFGKEYAPFITFCQEKIANNEKLPRSICFDRDGNIKKREYVHFEDEDLMPKQQNHIEVIKTDKQGNVLNRYPSISRAASKHGVTYYAMETYMSGKREHPLYNFIQAGDIQDKEGSENN